jgi:choline dehydrogenase-like flavoprotein
VAAPRDAHVEVVVVGSGAAGGVYADVLSRAGRQVLVLEAGRSRTVGEMVSSSIWSRRHKWSGAPVLAEGEHRIAHNVSTGSGLGGAAFHHYATWPRFPVDVFEMRSAHGRGLDWGLTYAELRPWYDRVQADVGISGDASREPWRGPGEPYPLPPLRTFRHGELLAAGFRKLELPVAPMPAAILSQEYADRAACLYDGWCDAGCPIGALANPLYTYLGWAQGRGVEVRTGAEVVRVLTDAKGRARGVEYVTNGERREQPADLVVLAASFIQNPRILFCSGESRRPGGGTNPGLANSSGTLGKYLLADAMGFAYGLFDEPTEIWMGVNSGQYYHHSGLRHAGRPELFGGVQWQIGPAAKPNDIFGVAVTRPDLYGQALHDFVRDATRHMAYMVGFVGGAPHAENRIELDPSRRDANGTPLARTIHRHDADTLALVEHVNRQGLAVLKAAGARTAWNGPLAGGHLSGGTIMGPDPATSVCDSYGRTHDVPNLVVGGAGLVPQAGGTSPTYTLHAVALRSAAHVVANWKEYAARA